MNDAEKALAKAGGTIPSVSGRYWATDRDKRWGSDRKGMAGDGQGRKPLVAVIIVVSK